MQFATRQAYEPTGQLFEQPKGKRLAEFEAELPAHLKSFGRTVHASLCGREGAPLVLVMGGISANRFPSLTPDGSPGWWASLARDQGGVDPRQFQILGFDFIADAEGRKAPSSHDQAEVIDVLLDFLGVEQVHAIVGASYGAMVALAFAQKFPQRVDRIVVISGGAEPHAASTAVRELQRRIVVLALASGKGAEGLSIARGLAMLTYRTREEFEGRFRGGIPDDDVLSCSEPGAYLRARGEAYPSVMSPERFLSLSASIDRHKVEPEAIRVPALVIGSESDQLVPPSQMHSLAHRFGGQASLHLLPSVFGHDMFLKDTEKLNGLVGSFLRPDR